MRVTLAIVLTCVLASQIAASPFVFQPGKEFVYHYVAQAATGIPNSGSQAAVIKGSATVRVQVKPAGKIIVALSDVAIKKVVGAIPAGAASALLPDSACEAITIPELEAIKDAVMRPMRCEYRNGMIISVEASASDPVWSVNVKKGIIAMLQMNLKAANQIKDAEPAIAEMFMANTVKPAAGAKYFRAMEAGIAGTCEAVYASMDAPIAIAAANASFAAAGCACTAAACQCAPAPAAAVMNGLPEMRVVKSWNYKNCALPPTVEHGIFTNLNLANGLSGFGKDLAIASVVADYVIAGDASNFVIKKAVQMSKFAVAPFAAEAGRMEANIIQVLVAIDAKDIGGAPILPGREHVALPSLKMEIPLEPIAAWPQASTAEKMAQVEAILEEVCAATTPVMQAAAPAVIIKMVHAIRECEAEVVQTIATKYVLSASAAADACAMKKREILLDVLPAVPSTAVIPVVVDMVHAGLVSAPRAIVMINTMILSAPPMPAAVTALMAALRDPAIAANCALKHTVLLGLGTVTNKMYHAHWKMGAVKAAAMPIIQQVIKELIAMYAAAATPAEKIAVLKACGNAGMPELLPKLAVLAADPAEPAAIRAQAIFACRRIASFAPSKAMALLLPMLMDMAEVQDVRIAAFVAIMDMQPSSGIMQMITHALKIETNTQVASFAYSYISTMAKSTHPAFEEMAGRCRHALMAVGPFIPTIFTSKALHLDSFMESLQMGAAIDMYIVNAPASAMPKAIVAKLNAFLLGQSINVAEMGVEAAGLQAIVHKLVGPYGILTSILNGKKSVMDMLAPIVQPAMGSMAHGVLTALKELGIVTRPDEALATAFYIKMFGNEIAAFAITEENFNAMIGDGSAIVAELERVLIAGAEMNMLKALALVDSAINIPTPLGVSLAIKLTAVAAVHAKGTAKLSGIASLAELMSSTVPTTPISAAINMAPSCMIEVSAHMAIDASILRAGTAIRALMHAQMPIAANFAVDMVSWKMNAKVTLPAAPQKIAAFEVVPICYVDVIHAAPKAAMFETVVAEIIDPAMIAALPIKAPIVISGCGVAVQIEGQIGVCIPAYAPAMPLCGRQTLQIMLAPAAAAATAAAAAEIEVELKYIGPMAAAAPAAPAAPAATVAPPTGGWTSWFTIPTFSSADSSVAAPPSAAALGAADFEPVTKAAAIQGAATTHAIQALVTCSAGSAAHTLAHGQITFLTSADLMACQMNAQVICLPAMGVAVETKVVTEIVALVPNMMAAFIPDITPVAPADVMCSATVAVFQASAPIAELAMKWAAGDMGIAADMPSLAASILPALAAAIPAAPAAAAAASPPAYSCTILCDVSKMPASMLEMPAALAVAAASALQPMLHLAAVPVPATVPAATAGQIAIIAKIIPAWQKMVVMIRGAAGAAFVMNVPIAMPMLYDVALAGALPAMPAAAPAPAAAMPPMPAAAFSIMDAYAGMCSLVADTVTTFDGVAITIPAAAAACEAVIAKDCSAQATFAVTATPEDASMAMKAIKVIVPGYMIEVMPDASGPVVAINGIPRVIPAAAPVTIAAGNAGAYVIARSDKMVVIAAKFLGLTIATDCEQVIVQASAMFRGKICGLCGNFDGESAGDMVDPAMNIAASDAAFVAQYVFKSNNCKAADIAEAAPAVAGDCALMPMAMNQMQERSNGRTMEYCFMVEPMAACPVSCIPAAAEKQLVAVHCLPANKMFAKELAQQTKVRVLHELEWKHIDAYETFEVPTACAPAA